MCDYKQTKDWFPSFSGRRWRENQYDDCMSEGINMQSWINVYNNEWMHKIVCGRGELSNGEYVSDISIKGWHQWKTKVTLALPTQPVSASTLFRSLTKNKHSEQILGAALELVQGRTN